MDRLIKFIYFAVLYHRPVRMFGSSYGYNRNIFVTKEEIENTIGKMVVGGKNKLNNEIRNIRYIRLKEHIEGGD